MIEIIDKNMKKTDVFTHDLVYEKDGNEAVFHEWYENDEGYYVDICTECYNEYAYPLFFIPEDMVCSLMDDSGWEYNDYVCQSQHCARRADYRIYFKKWRVKFRPKLKGNLDESGLLKYEYFYKGIVV